MATKKIKAVYNVAIAGLFYAIGFGMLVFVNGFFGFALSTVVWTTGEITSRTEFEGRSPHHYIQAGNGWQPDPYRDDISLVLKTNQGLVVICGCCHAGILNTLFHVERKFGGPILAVLGGLHLLYAEDQYLEHVVQVFDERFPDVSFYLNHCTGENAFNKLAAAFGSQIRACPAGTLVNIND